MELSLVEKHLLDLTTADEDAQLESDLLAWRDTLNKIYYENDTAISDLNVKRLNELTYKTFKEQKAELIKRKYKCVQVIKHVKSLISEKNRAANAPKTKTEPDRGDRMLDELTAIRVLLERIVKKTDSQSGEK